MRVVGGCQRKEVVESLRWRLASGNTHAVCGLCSPFPRNWGQALECAGTAVVRPHMNDCLLSLMAAVSLVFDSRVFNGSVKSRVAAEDAYLHFLYFSCIMEREMERRG